MERRFTRRSWLLWSVAFSLAGRAQIAIGAPDARGWSFPIRLAGREPGDGFLIRHGFATENTAFYPGEWHTGENWYALEGDTAGADVLAVADGEIVFTGFDYPGPVMIIQHAEGLYSMYGHLDYALAVESGSVNRGHSIGTVLNRTDGRSASHLHFEIRQFLTTPEVNGPTPRYNFTCDLNCPPGPGYWPMNAPELPTGMGWLNPTHVIARRAFPGSVPESGVEVMVATGARKGTEVWSAPSDQDGARILGQLPLIPGMKFPLLDIDAGAEAPQGTSAEAYRLWYHIEVPDIANPVWVAALYPTIDAVGADGRPSAIRFDFIPSLDPA